MSFLSLSHSSRNIDAHWMGSVCLRSLTQRYICACVCVCECLYILLASALLTVCFTAVHVYMSTSCCRCHRSLLLFVHFSTCWRSRRNRTYKYWTVHDSRLSCHACAVWTCARKKIAREKEKENRLFRLALSPVRRWEERHVNRWSTIFHSSLLRYVEKRKKERNERWDAMRLNWSLLAAAVIRLKLLALSMTSQLFSECQQETKPDIWNDDRWSMKKICSRKLFNYLEWILHWSTGQAEPWCQQNNPVTWNEWRRTRGSLRQMMYELHMGEMS